MTDKQERLLQFILDFHKENGYSPSIREMAQGMGVSSPSTIKAMLDRLEAKGMLTKSSGRARSLTTTMQEEDKGIPVIGRIVAGTPVMAEENIEGYIPVKEFLKNSNGGFFLIVDGYSMKDKGILPGDYVFIQPCKEISNGQIGAFRLNGEVTLKTFKKSIIILVKIKERIITATKIINILKPLEIVSILATNSALLTPNPSLK